MWFWVLVGFLFCFKYKADTGIILAAKNTAYETCSFLRISPTGVSEAMLGKHRVSVPARGLLLSTDFLAGMGLCVAAARLL